MESGQGGQGQQHSCQQYWKEGWKVPFVKGKQDTISYRKRFPCNCFLKSGMISIMLAGYQNWINLLFAALRNWDSGAKPMLLHTIKPYYEQKYILAKNKEESLVENTEKYSM